MSEDYDHSLEFLTTYNAPTAPFPNQQPGPERLSVFNKLFNPSDLYNLEQEKMEKRKIKKQQKQEADKRKQIREQKKIEVDQMNAILVRHQMVKCGCSGLCTGRCKCKKSLQACSQYCGCSCVSKLEIN